MKKLKQVRELIFKISNVKNLLKTLPLLAILMVITSCSSVRVATDFDKNADFNNYKTFAFFKTGIDKAEISDLDKRRILRAIETELLAKGFTKSENPDLLISLFTKSTQRVDVYNNYWGYGAWGWGGYGPGWGWGWNQQPNVSTTTEGTLFIDLIDANKKELVWQGMGTGYLSRNMDKKEERIKEFVAKIMEKYPPGMGQ
ncbi:MAG: DUF4136 domain-containing protein [Flavobacteriales bacterium]|nr:DUF4136 domain-containing protein [Flavobacteriales bacterium]NCP51007.1 DUF4136 domain-containing protein [Flavobacteriales bacterium]NCP90505.1 DUF4136 domain-containing protein [Flavobacteriales bacterium]NCQ13827.1 DUF4136 domain-containing protein [Flavobacteriales bacterium]NCQ57894.1 DUF4136 domain-containing protein [Flavobacteriales bacterium]